MEFNVLINDAAKSAILKMSPTRREHLKRIFEFLEVGLWEGGLRIKKLKGLSRKVILEGRISRGERLLFTLGRGAKDQTDIYVWAILPHDEVERRSRTILPEIAPFLNFTRFEREKAKDVDLSSIDGSFFTQEGIHQVSDQESSPQRWFRLTDEAWKRLLLYSKGDFEIFLYLTPQQEDLLEKSPPLIISGTAGSGKTTLCVYYLFRPFLLNKSKLFLTYNPFLKDFSQKLYRGLSAHCSVNDKKTPEFLTFKDLCRRFIPESNERYPPEKEMDYGTFSTLSKSFKIRGNMDSPLVWEEIRSIIKGAKPQISVDTLVETVRKLKRRDESRIAMRNLKEELLSLHSLSVAGKCDAIFTKVLGRGILQATPLLEEIVREDPLKLMRALTSVVSILKKHEADFRNPLMTLREYEQLGHKRAPNFLHNRREIHTTATRYQKFLETRGYWDEIDLTRAAIRAIDEGKSSIPNYHFVICDEVQDFTDVQLSLLIRLPSAPQNLLIAGDSKQIINPSGFRWEEVKRLFYDRNLPVPEVDFLTINFRCVGNIVQLANALLALKEALLGKHRDERADEWRFSGKMPFLIRGVAPETLLHHINVTAADQVILTRTVEEKVFLKKSLETELVFTIEEAKGLEFQTVLLWRFSSTPGVEDLWSDIVNLSTQKHHESLIRHEINLLYVGITRARHNLIIYDGESPSVIWSSERVKGLLFATNDVEVLSQAWKRISTLEEWEKQGMYFLEHHIYRAAAECFRNAEKPLLMHQALALACEKSGEYLKAAMHLESAGEREKAADLYERGEAYEKAFALWKVLKKREAMERCQVKLWENEEKYDLLASTMEKRKDYKAAIGYWQKAGNDKRVVLLYQREKDYAKAARACERMKDWTRAARFYKKSKELERAARCLEKSGDLWSACKIWKRLKQSREELRCLKKLGDPILLAEYYERIGEWEKAIRYYEKGRNDQLVLRFQKELEKKPRGRAGHARRGVRLLFLGHYREAGQAFDRAKVFDLAADAFLRADDYEAAAFSFFRGQQWMDAIKMLVRSKHWGVAEIAFKNLQESSPLSSWRDEMGDFMTERFQQKDYEGLSFLLEITGDRQQAAEMALKAGSAGRAANLWEDPWRIPWAIDMLIAKQRFETGFDFIMQLNERIWIRDVKIIERFFKALLRHDGSDATRRRIGDAMGGIPRGFSLPFIFEIFEPMKDYNTILTMGKGSLHTDFKKKKWYPFLRSESRGRMATGDWNGAAVCFLLLEEYGEAAECLERVAVTKENVLCMEEASLWRKALRYYEENGAWFDAGRAAVQCKEGKRAHDLFIKSEEYYEGAKLLAKSREFDRAYSLYCKAESWPKAARMLEKLGRYEEAIEVWKRVGRKKEVARVRRKIPPPGQRTLFNRDDPRR